jgi:hypothetical protein
MSESELPTFDDPRLRAVLHHALGSDKAPDSLRLRVQKILAHPSLDFPIHAKKRVQFWQHPLLNLAAAAVLLVCIGLAGWRFGNHRDSTRLALTTAALPDAFARDLVATHDHCCALPDHHILKGVPDDDFRMMTQKLRDQLGFPALAVTAGDGWTFYGASAFCMVGKAHSAHLVFKRNGESLSIFSVAISSESWTDGHAPAEGASLSNMKTGHAILSWVHDGTVYSVVGASADGSLNLHDLTPIADRLRVAISGPESASPDRTSLALR